MKQYITRKAYKCNNIADFIKCQEYLFDKGLGWVDNRTRCKIFLPNKRCGNGSKGILPLFLVIDEKNFYFRYSNEMNGKEHSIYKESVCYKIHDFSRSLKLKKILF